LELTGLTGSQRIRARPSTVPIASNFKRQVAQEFTAGEALHGLSQRRDVSRNLIRIWVKKLETGGVRRRCPSNRPSSGIRGEEHGTRAHGREAGTRNRVSKGGAQKRTTAEKRDYIRHHRPCCVAVAEGCRRAPCQHRSLAGQEHGRTIPLPDAARSTLKRQPPTTVSIRSKLLSYSVLSIRPTI